MEILLGKKRIVTIQAASVALIFILFTPVHADYSLSPMGLTLGKNQRTGALTVTNDGAERINIQLTVSEWNQDANGNDVYSRTKDIVFYPKVLVIEPRSEQVVRVGYQGPVPAREKAYRLFVKEAPSPSNKKALASISIGVRFLLPVFFLPPVEVASGAIESISLSARSIKTTVKNTGTVHLKISSLKIYGKAADGSDVFSKEIQGWYILQGLSHTYEIPIAPEDCSRLSVVDVEAQSASVALNSSFKVGEDLCR